MRVLLLSKYGRLGASSRVRSYLYLPYLESCGIDVTIAPLLGDEYVKDLYAGRRMRWAKIVFSYLRRITLLLTSRRYDLVWIEKELLPWIPAWVELPLVRLGVPYIVDYDDAVFHRYDLSSNPFVRSLLGKKIDALMRWATIVIVGNDYLAERARKAGAPRVEYLPTVVDLNRYPLSPYPQHSEFTVGWIGSPGTAKYLEIVAPALKTLARQGNLRVVLVGSGPVRLEGVPIEVRPWSEETEVRDIQDIDVGIMPLPDAPWERGKCGYKLIQYMAVGRAVVASPVGVNTKIVEHGVNGFWASTTEEWVRALSILRDRRELRVRMGLAGRQKVEAEYSLHIAAPRLAALLRSAVRDVVV